MLDQSYLSYLKHLDIVVLHVFESRRKRAEVLLVLLLARCGDGGQGTAVERTDRCDDHRGGDPKFCMCVFTSQLYGGFIRLGARIAEEGL